MPELAEVETWRRLAESAFLGATVQRCRAGKDDIVFDRESAATVSRRCKGRTLVGARRRGKHLWLAWDRAPHTYVHFGTSGWFEVVSSEDPSPRFTKIRWDFDTGQSLCYACIRRIGRIRLLTDPLNEAPFNKLGKDPFIDAPPVAWYQDVLSSSKRPIKSLLLEQKFFAGVGNWLADEVLYQARIAPQRSDCVLTPAEVSRVRSRLHAIVNKAVAVEADERRFPRTWLFHTRWGKSKDARTANGEAITFDTIGGRTTAWVPSRQK